MEALLALVHQYSNTYCYCTNKKLVNVDYSVLTEKIKAPSSLKQQSLRLMIELELVSIKIFYT